MNKKKSPKGPSRRQALQMGGIVLLLGTRGPWRMSALRVPEGATLVETESV